MSKKLYEIRDPIHGLVRYNDLEREVINSLPFQRLRRIKQLAWTDFVYPGAMHTRFEHSIGVMHVAGRLFDRLMSDDRSRDILISQFGVKNDEVARCRQNVRLAALCHDLGHGPFSHAAEELFPSKLNGDKGRIPHEEYSLKVIVTRVADVLKSHSSSNELGLDASTIGSFVDGVPKDGVVALLKDIVSGTLDADRMDYLQRDAYHCGVRYGQYDFERVVNTIGICEDFEDDGEFRVGIDDDGVHAAEGLVTARFMMFTQVYMHKTRGIYDYHFEMCMKELLKDNNGHFPDPNSTESLSRFLEWDDWRVLGQIQQGGGGEHGGLIRNRKHHRLVFETQEVYDDEGKKDRANKRFEKVKAAIGKFGGIELPASKSWYSQKAGSDILVRNASSTRLTGRPLSESSNVVKSLKPVNQRRLYVPYEHRDSAREIVEKMSSTRG